MKRKAERDPASEAPNLGSLAEKPGKRRRGGQAAPKTGGEAHGAPHIIKRGRGRPPSEKTLRKREREAKQAAEAFAAVLERAQNSPVIKRGPSVDDQVKRLQQDDAETGHWPRRRRSSSMDRLYGRPEQKVPGSSRLRSASTADTEDLEAAMEDEDLTEAMDGDLKEEEGVSVEIDTEVAAEVGVEPLIGMSASSAHPAADTDKQHLAEAAAEPASLAFAIGVVEETDAEEQTRPDSRAAAIGNKPLHSIAELPAKPASQPLLSAQAMNNNTANAEQGAVADEHAEADGQSAAIKSDPSAPVPAPAQGLGTLTEHQDLLRSVPANAKADVKTASAPVTPAPAAAEQSLEAPAANAAAFAAMGSTSALHRPSSAPTRRLARKSSPVSTPSERAACKGGTALMKQTSPEGSCAPAPAKEASPKGSPASTPKRRLSPESTPVYIPLGKAAEPNGGISPVKRARPSPSEPATAAPTLAAAGPKSAATTPAAQARAAKLTKRAKAPSKLQLDGVQQRRLTRSAAPAGAKQSSVSPPQQPDLARAPEQRAQPSMQPQALNGLTKNLSPTDELTPSVELIQPEHHASAAETRAEQLYQATKEAEPPAQEASRSALSGPPMTEPAGTRAAQPLGVAAKAVPVTSSAEKRGSGPMAYLMDRPKAPSPRVTAIAAPRPVAATDHRLSRLTDSSQESALTDVTPKVEESPEAVEERRQLQKQQELERKAREHQKVLKQIEAGLDRPSTGSSFIRDMTVLVLDPAAQGLEPRIVRGILERLEQDAVMAHSAAPEANSNRKVALLYVLDSALKSGKARELKLKDKDPGMAKSMQRFCNAVAAGLPALLRATQNDPSCYDKTLKVFQVWHDRGVLANKVLEPHLAQLKSNPVTAAPADEPDELMQPAKLDEFGLELADDDDSSDEGGWGDDDAAPTLKELPKLPQVEEAHLAPWQRSGGTDRAVGVAPDSPEGSPWHQGPSPTYSLPGEAYPAPAGQYLGSETPPFEEKAARAPWHQPAPAERPVQNGIQPPMGAPPHLRPMYPHQMASASYQMHPPQFPSQGQPQAPPVSWQFRPPVTGPPTASGQFTAAPGIFPQAQRQGPPPPRGPPFVPIALPAPGHVAQPPVMAAMQSFGQPPRHFGDVPQPDPYLGFDRQGSMPGLLPSAEPSFMPPLPPDEPPPLPDEAPPPLPDEAPPPPLLDQTPLPEDDFDAEMADAAHSSHPQQPVMYPQQLAYSYRQGH